MVVGAVAPEKRVGDREAVGAGHPRRLVPPRVPQLVVVAEGRPPEQDCGGVLSSPGVGTGGCTPECLGGVLAGGNWRRETEREAIVVRNGGSG